MNTSPLCHRRSVTAKVCILFACVLVVVVCEVVTVVTAVGQASPANLIAETVEDIQARRPIRQAAASVAVSKKQLVREVDHQDWHLLDGDQLLPNNGNGGDALDVLQKRREQREAADEAAATPVSILVEPRQPAPVPRRLDCVSPPVRSFPDGPQPAIHAPQQKPLHVPVMAFDAPAAPPPPHHGEHVVLAEPKVPAAPLSPLSVDEDADAAKIALASLRLVVHVTNGQEEDDVEEAKKAAGLVRARVAKQQQQQDGPDILIKEPQRNLNVRAALPARKVLESAPLAARGADNADSREAARKAHLVLQSEQAKADAPKRAYTEEELRQRCVLANGRAAQSATLRAMLEGRLGKDCLVVAADVGNDIPGEKNNAKAAVSIVTVFVSTLFVVFAFCF